MEVRTVHRMPLPHEHVAVIVASHFRVSGQAPVTGMIPVTCGNTGGEFV